MNEEQIELVLRGLERAWGLVHEENAHVCFAGCRCGGLGVA